MKVLALCLMGLATALAQNPRLETNVSSVQLTLHKSDPQTRTFQIIVGNLSNHTLTEYCTIDEILQSCIVNLGIGPHKTALLIRPVGFLVAAGLFDNGTYQGDFDTAARLAANQIAQQVQFQRARQIIDKALAVENDPLNFAVIEKGLTGLSEEPEEGMLLLARKEFPELSLDDPDRAALILQEGLRDFKTGLLVQLKSWKEQSSSRPPLSTWWKGIQESYMITWGKMANHDMTVPQCDQCPKFKHIPVIRTTTLVGEETSAPPPAPKPVPVAVISEPPPERIAPPTFQPPPVPEPVAVERSVFQAGVQPASNYQPLPPKPLTRQAVYSIFFMIVNNQDLITAGPNASRSRNYQSAIGLKDREWKILKGIAGDCDQAYMAVVMQSQPIVMAYFQKSPRGPYPPPEFKPIEEKQNRTIESYVTKLKLKIGTAAFKKVDAFVQKQFIQDWTNAGGGIKAGAPAGLAAQRPVSPSPPLR